MPSLKNSGISDILKPIEKPLRDVNALMTRQFADCAPSIQELVAAFTGSGGKMLRPALLLLSARCFSPLTDAHIRAAAVIQMLHNATLLHDDVIDGGQKRRGKPTINALWGNEAAVIFGDLVFSKALLLAADMDSAAFAAVTDAMARVCAGELRQMLNRSNWQLTESDYIEIITEKSASLFSACCRVGAILASANAAEAETMSRFGLDTGIAFQITDDILDITADEKRTGKTAGSDLDDNKLTLPVIHLLTTLPADRKQRFIEKLLDTGNRDAIREMLDSSQSVDYARKRAALYATQAARRLDDIGDGDAKAALVETAGFIARRS